MLAVAIAATVILTSWYLMSVFPICVEKLAEYGVIATVQVYVPAVRDADKVAVSINALKFAAATVFAAATTIAAVFDSDAEGRAVLVAGSEVTPTRVRPVLVDVSCSISSNLG